MLISDLNGNGKRFGARFAAVTFGFNYDFYKEDFMRSKTHNRFAAVFLALAMLLTSVSFSAFTVGKKASAAAGGTYTFVAGEATGDKVFSKDKTAGQQVPLTDYFTLYCNTGTALNDGDKSNTKDNAGSKKDFDGEQLTGRLNFGGKSEFKADGNHVNLIKFTTEAAATVTVWAVRGENVSETKPMRDVIIYDENGTKVDSTEDDTAFAAKVKNDPCKVTLNVGAAGTYYLGNTNGNNYFFKVEVAEKAAGPAVEYKEYVLDAATDVEAAAAGTLTAPGVITKADGFTFTAQYSAKSKIENKDKSFNDGYKGTRRINFGDAASVSANSIKFTTTGPATVRVWWAVGADGRQMTVLDKDGKAVYTSTGETKKDAATRTTLKLNEAGDYYLGGSGGNNYIFKVMVRYGNVPLNDWSKIAAPEITEAQDDGAGNIVVKVNAAVGEADAELLTVTMYDETGNEVGSNNTAADAVTHEVKLTPKKSGNYTFKAAITRGEDKKESAVSAPAAFVLPLGKPIMSSVTSKGNGKIGIVWGAVAEATGYKIFRDGTEVGTATETNFTDTGLTVGTKYSYTVKAVRGADEGPESAAMATTATEEEQQVWSFVRFGTSTDDKNNGFEGAANDGKVTVFSEGGKGKVQPGSNDGLAFYYTALPTGKNFTFRAKAHLENWVVNNGQEGFGLLAMDSVPDPSNGSAAFWTNKYMAVVSKMEYYWDSEFNELTDDITLGTKYTMNLGVGVNAKQGINAETLEKIKANDSETIKAVCGSQYTLETSAVGRDAGTYNLVDCGEQTSKGTNIAKLTDFILEIQKNNTGYFITYYDEAGNVIGQKKFYDTNALSVMDKDNVYVGFFAARSMRASFSDISIKMTDPANDPPAEERPATTVRPNLSFKSASVANSTDYELRLFPNTDGKADISVNGKVVSSGVELKGKDRKDIMIKLTDGRVNKVSVSFTATGASEPVVKELNVRLDNRYASLKTIYVSPEGTSKGNGSPEKPLDIQTAVNVARPGQTIAVIAGTYLMSAPVTIERGMDGTAENPIRMIAVANPTARAAEERAIFDFQKQKGGFALGGDYWYIRGIDIANAGDGSAGIRIYGHNNTLDQVNAYGNGKTGISISTKESATDKKDIDWPSNNLILNCTSHNNADVGYEDADGFEAKLTCGEGNVFDGCVAYNNADDGWDLYARLSSGPIGAVTIQNCIAYGNGYLEDGTNAGNGNGFKLGGDGIGVKHKIINSIAFNNKADGITSNSNPNVIVENCTSYNNEKSNLNLYGKGENTDFEVKGFISFKDSNIKSGLDVADQFKAAGTQDAAKYQSEFNYFWNGTESANSKGAKVAADIFQSLKFAGSVARNDNGTIKLDGFLELSDKAPKGTGAVLSLTASKDIGEIKPDEKYPEISDNLPTGVSIPFAGATVAILGAAVAIIMSKRKRG